MRGGVVGFYHRRCGSTLEWLKAYTSFSAIFSLQNALEHVMVQRNLVNGATAFRHDRLVHQLEPLIDGIERVLESPNVRAARQRALVSYRSAALQVCSRVRVGAGVQVETGLGCRMER